jgi:hypothetical protein
MLIWFLSLEALSLRETLRETYDVICQISAHHIEEGGDRVAAWTFLLRRHLAELLRTPLIRSSYYPIAPVRRA